MHKKSLFIIFLIGFNSFSQEIHIDAESNYSFNKNNEELLIFKKDSVSIYDVNSFHLLERKEIISPPNFNFIGYHILDLESIHFVEINGGKVYQLNNDTIQRIDNSYTHKMTWDSNLFTYNDTIYRYGGYGFWTTNNKLTFYDTVTNEWQIISSVNGIYPKGSCSSFYLILNDKLYILGGEKVDSKDLNHRVNNDEIWSFDFKAKKWENIGVLNQNIKYRNNSFQLNGNIFSATHEFMIEVDFKKNLLKEYALDPLIQKTIDGVYKPFVHKDNIYLWIQYDSGLKLVKTKIDNLHFNLANEQALVKNNYIVALKLVIAIACVCLLIFLFSFRKKYKNNSNKLLFKDNKVIIKDNVTNLDTAENKLLTLLINNDFSITNEKLVNNFYNADLDRSQNIRNINKFISDLNLKLKTMLNTDTDIIYKSVNSLDKRMKIVMLNRDFIRN
jgi:hypothetical protein